MWNNWIKEDSITYTVLSVVALQLLSKGAIPTYACIYQSMLSLFDLKSLLTISIIIGLLFVYIFCHYNRKNTFE